MAENESFDQMVLRTIELQDQIKAAGALAPPQIVNTTPADGSASKDHEGCRRCIADLETQLEQAKKPEVLALPKLEESTAVDPAATLREELEKALDKLRSVKAQLASQNKAAVEAKIEIQALRDDNGRLRRNHKRDLDEFDTLREEIKRLTSVCDGQQTQERKQERIIHDLRQQVKRSKEAATTFNPPKRPSRDNVSSRYKSTPAQSKSTQVVTVPNYSSPPSKVGAGISTGYTLQSPDLRDIPESARMGGPATSAAKTSFFEYYRSPVAGKRAWSESIRMESSKKPKVDGHRLPSDGYPRTPLKYDED